MAGIAAQSQLLTSKGGILFLIGKVVRFVFFFVFLYSVLSGVGSLAGYSREQVILFFLVFNIIDIIIQFLFRGVYVFRPLLISGNYDLDLLKPLPSYFRPLFGWTDILDLITLFPLLIFSFYYIFTNQLLVSSMSIILFVLLLLNSVLLGFAFHLLVCSIGILTTEVDHLIWIYRDLTGMARFPTDIYGKGVRSVLTFVIPVIVLITIPTKALLGLLSPGVIIISFLIGILASCFSLKFWFWAVKKYSSASS